MLCVTKKKLNVKNKLQITHSSSDIVIDGCAVLCCAVLGWAVLGWAGLGLAWLDWAVLCWVGLCCEVLCCAASELLQYSGMR